MALPGVITSFPNETYTVTRVADGSYNASGVYVPGASSSFTIVANIQPAGAQETGLTLQVVPEGFHNEEMRRISTVTPLLTKDVVTIDMDEWKVVRVKRHTVFGVHYVAYAARQVIP